MSDRVIFQGWQEWDRPPSGTANYGPRFVCAARTEAEAQTELDTFAKRQRARGHGADRYWVEPKQVETDFVIPSPLKPRDLYIARCRRIGGSGGWPKQEIIVEMAPDDRSTTAEPRFVTRFERNYSNNPFEPFRQGDRDYALCSPDYTATSVLDLSTGKVIASEEPSGTGFCPVGFYVPDWWDVHDDSVIEGSHFWGDPCEWPNGSFGFVWGCIWGDDLSWKVQYLDLSNITEGVITRDNRFGYVEMANIGDNPSEFIHIDTETGLVRFAVEKHFRLESGEPVMTTSVHDEAVRRLTDLIQKTHGVLADIEKSSRQALTAVETIRDLLRDDSCRRCFGSAKAADGAPCMVCDGVGIAQDRFTREERFSGWDS